MPAKERAAALGAIGEIAQVGAEGVSSYAEAILPLIVDGARSGATRAAAIVALGQWVEATGSAVRPFAEHPHLLRLLLRVVVEESGETRAQTLRTLGVLGALDPLTHKDNEERLHGQGLLSMEGVRGVGRDEAEDEETKNARRDETDRADAGVFQNLETDSATSDERLRVASACTAVPPPWTNSTTTAATTRLVTPSPRATLPPRRMRFTPPRRSTRFCACSATPARRRGTTR